MPAELIEFNPYVLRAVDFLAQNYAGLGYGNSAFTHDLPFGKDASLKAQKPPYTMCVAAQLEIIVTALNIYAEETNDYSPFSFLPRTSWERLGKKDLRGMIWIVEGSGSLGTADALTKFGMGELRPFSALTPGSFVNLNRKKTGHAVTFLAYLDAAGTELSEYSGEVVGFKYFSSQGNKENGGFGYRWAFFSDVPCPTLNGGRQRDCGVLRSDEQKILNTGVLLRPAQWSSPQIEILEGDDVEGIFDDTYFDGLTTDD